MGYKKPSQRGLSHHLQNYHITVSAMRRDGWVVKAHCTACYLDCWVDLTTIIRLSGPETRLFGRTTRCRRYACPGRMVFLATPPGELHGAFWELEGPPNAAAGASGDDLPDP